MKQCFCFKTDNLLKMVPNLKITLIPALHETEDDAHKKGEYHITNRDDITDIRYYHSLWTSTTVYFGNGTKQSLYANNVNVNDTSLVRVNQNDFLSPAIKISGDYVEFTNELAEWLNYNGVQNSDFVEHLEQFTVYEAMEYPGVSTPSKCGKYWGYSNETLVLKEEEIKTVLDSIEDELLRKKIECILYARIFKKKY